MGKEEKNKPVFECRTGQIKATMWENVLENDKVFKNIVITKVYKDKNDNWQSTFNFAVFDIPKIIIVLNKCYENELFKDKNTEETKKDSGK